MPQDIDINSTTWVLIILVRLAVCVAIVILGRWLARIAQRWTHAGFQRVHAPESLANTLERAVYAGVLLLMVVGLLIALGIPWEVVVTIVAVMLVAEYTTSHRIADMQPVSQTVITG